MSSEKIRALVPFVAFTFEPEHLARHSCLLLVIFSSYHVTSTGFAVKLQCVLRNIAWREHPMWLVRSFKVWLLMIFGILVKAD